MPPQKTETVKIEVQHYRDNVKPVSLLVVSLGKVLNEIASTYEWLDW